MPAPSDLIHWPRWVQQGLMKAVDSVKGSYVLYHEGEDRKTTDEYNFAEVRIDGPDITMRLGEAHLKVTLNVLVSNKVHLTQFYQPEIVVGNFLRAFAEPIAVFRTGSNEDDDGTLFTCFKLDTPIEVNKFGLVDTGVDLIQHTIQATYRGWTNLRRATPRAVTVSASLTDEVAVVLE